VENRDSEDASFDIPPAWEMPIASPERSAVLPPADILTTSKVEAVRFNTGRNGYAYRQVEHFVGQVKNTLAHLEALSHQQASDIYQLREENDDLHERIQTLQATIEVFRAKGDPLTGTDGSYITESKNESAAEIQTLRAELEATKASLAQALSEAQTAWAAEEEMRTYVNETLLPWIAANAPQQTQASEATETLDHDDVEITETQAQPTPTPPVVEYDEEIVDQNHTVNSVSENPVVQENYYVAPELQPEIQSALAEESWEEMVPTEQENLEPQLPPQEAPPAEYAEVVERPAESTLVEVVQPVSPFGMPAEEETYPDVDELIVAGQGAEPNLAGEYGLTDRDNILAAAPELSILPDPEPEDTPPPPGADPSSPRPAGAPLPPLLATAPELMLAEDDSDETYN